MKIPVQGGVHMKNTIRKVFACMAMTWATQAAFAQPLLLVTANYPPFSYEEGGVQKGIAIDLVKEAFARMQQEVRIQLVPFPRAVAMIKNGEADGIFPFAMSEDRKEFASYPAERLFADPGTLFVRADSTITFNGDFSKLKNFTIGMQRGTNHGPVFMQALKTYEIKTDEANDQEQNMLKLTAGRFDIAVGPKLVVMSAAKRVERFSAIKVLYTGISEGDAYVGFTKQRNMDQVIARFEQVIKKMRQDGSYEKIMRSH